MCVLFSSLISEGIIIIIHSHIAFDHHHDDHHPHPIMCSTLGIVYFHLHQLCCFFYVHIICFCFVFFWELKANQSKWAREIESEKEIENLGPAILYTIVTQCIRKHSDWALYLCMIFSLSFSQLSIGTYSCCLCVLVVLSSFSFVHCNFRLCEGFSTFKIWERNSFFSFFKILRWKERMNEWNDKKEVITTKTTK